VRADASAPSAETCTTTGTPAMAQAWNSSAGARWCRASKPWPRVSRRMPTAFTTASIPASRGTHQSRPGTRAKSAGTNSAPGSGARRVAGTTTWRARAQRLRDRAADEPGGAGDEDPHGPLKSSPGESARGAVTA